MGMSPPRGGADGRVPRAASINVVAAADTPSPVKVTVDAPGWSVQSDETGGVSVQSPPKVPTRTLASERESRWAAHRSSSRSLRDPFPSASSSHFQRPTMQPRASTRVRIEIFVVSNFDLCLPVKLGSRRAGTDTHELLLSHLMVSRHARIHVLPRCSITLGRRWYALSISMLEQRE